MIKNKKWSGSVAVAAAAALAMTAACSSSKSSSPAPTTAAANGGGSGSSQSTSSGSTGGGQATGSPITISTITQIGTPNGTFPGLVAAMNAAARTINEAGGVNGHPIKVTSCNGKTDPNQEVTCARQAVSNNAVAMVGPLLVVNPSGDLKVLQDAGIADLGGAAAATVELQNPIAFPLDAGSFTPAGCLSIVKSGLATKVATVSSDIGAIKANAVLVDQAAQKLNIPIGANITLPATAPDVTSQVQQLTNSGANGVVMFAVPNQAAQVLAASAQLGKKSVFCTSDGLLPGAVLSQLGPAASNVYITATLPPLSAASSNPGVAKFISDMGKEAASGDKDAVLGPTYSSTSMRAWAAVEAFAQIAKTITGTIDKTSFLAAIKKANAVTTGVYPTVDFTKSQGGSTYPGLYNPAVQILKWDTSKKDFVTTTTTFDATTVLP